MAEFIIKFGLPSAFFFANSIDKVEALEESFVFKHLNKNQEAKQEVSAALENKETNNEEVKSEEQK